MSELATHRLFFDIIRNFLWGENIIQCETSIKEVILLADKHAILPLVADVLLKNKSLFLLEDSAKNKLKQRIIQNLLNQSRLNQTHIKVKSVFDANGIESVLLKGMGLAYIYKNPDLRVCGDVDLYIQPKDFHQSCQILRKIPNCKINEYELDDDLHYKVNIDGCYIEIHSVTASIQKALKPFYSKLEYDGLLKSEEFIEINKTKVKVPEVEFNIIFVLLHILGHFNHSGIGWRQLIDWTLLLHHRYTFYDDTVRTQKDAVLEDTLIRLNIYEIWQTFGYVVVKYLGLPSKEMPFYTESVVKYGKRVCNRIMDDGNFSRENVKAWHAAPKNKIVKVLYSFKNMIVNYMFTKQYFPQTAINNLSIFLHK